MTRRDSELDKTPLEAWADDTTGPKDFPARMASRQTLPNNLRLRLNETYARPGAQRTAVRTDSVPVSYPRTSTYATSSTGLSRNPGLTGSFTPSTTSTSISTSQGANLLLQGTRLLETASDDSNLLVLPTSQFLANPKFQCLFEALECDESFDDGRVWETHVLGHFRTLNPPSTARCCMCDAQFSDIEYGNAWHAYLRHVAGIHFRQGHTLSTARPDFELYRWLFTNRLIDSRTYKRVVQLVSPRRNDRGAALLTPQIGTRREPVASVSNPGLERRQRRRQNSVASYQ